MADRVWLDVPYAEKDDAKAAGARWDPQARRWFAPRPGVGDLARWAALPALPTLLPGEDRNFGTGLFVDLVPRSCWFTNVRSCTDSRDWDRLRRMVYARAGHRCEACGQPEDRDRQVRVEAHERWHFDDTTFTQHLRRLVCLCGPCHDATHFGLAMLQQRDGPALAHLTEVNGWDHHTLTNHLDHAFDIWGRRNLHHWTLDLSILTTAGIRLAPTPDARRRYGLAATLGGSRASAALLPPAHSR
ncbi:MAG: DUF5710 domain-containing protein [Nocardioides sp.]